jgi:hypothetical protein
MYINIIAVILSFGFAAAASAQVKVMPAVPAPSSPEAVFEQNSRATETFSEAADSRYDTSGCSVETRRLQKGPVAVSAAPVPRRNCWNIPGSGVLVEYKWRQVNAAEPQKTNIGFWFSMNNAAQYGKASSYKCEREAQAGYGHDTSGNAYYVCTAAASFRFGSYPDLLTYAYDQAGRRNMWDIQVAVSLDDNGSWDSLNGSNYTFRF